MKIKVENVTKDIKKNEIIHDVSCEFENGKIYGLIGRNGSGKTVFMKLLCGLYSTTKGNIYIDDEVINLDNNYKFGIGALIESPKFFNDLSGFENLKMLAKINNKINNKDIDKALEIVNLLPEKNKKFGKYSLGMKQKLGIAQAIMEDPKIIILDEPFNGIEEQSVTQIKKYLKEIKKDKIIIISSHIKEDLIDFMDETLQFDAGKIVSKKDQK